jgi:type I restriction enzyme S subunit
MNATRLLEHFDRISDAADAVHRLRRFVLDLAVRGKIVDQDDADEPASVLLSRIAAAKRFGPKKSKVATSANATQAGPFSIPSSWTFSCIEEVGEISPRNEADAETTAAFIPMAMISQIFGVAPSHEVRRWGDIKKGYTHVAPGDVAVAKITPCFENGKSTVFGELENGIGAATTELHVVRPFLINPGYLLIFLKSPFFIDNGTPRMTGTAGQKRLPADYFATAPLPLPPLAEQQRIVAKVDELMALCDRLEAAQVEREARRDRLVAVSLARVSQPAADAASDARAAGFHLDHFARLTTRPEHVKHLRQTILKLAVRGRLVPQDPCAAPLAEALQSAAAVTHCADLPRAWVRVPLGRLATVMDSGWSPQCDSVRRSSVNDWAVLKTTAVQPLFFDCKEHKVLPAKLKPRPQCEAQFGDVLITRAGPKNRVGVCCVVNQVEPRLMISDKLIRLRLHDDVWPDFIALSLNAGEAQAAIEAAKSGMAVMQMNISQAKLRAVPIPLPPLAEQRRIVAKVDELMALCDQLEASLAAAATDRARLLESLLHEALATAT